MITLRDISKELISFINRIDPNIKVFSAGQNRISQPAEDYSVITFIDNHPHHTPFEVFGPPDDIDVSAQGLTTVILPRIVTVQVDFYGDAALTSGLNFATMFKSPSGYRAFGNESIKPLRVVSQVTTIDTPTAQQEYVQRLIVTVELWANMDFIFAENYFVVEGVDVKPPVDVIPAFDA